MGFPRLQAREDVNPLVSDQKPEHVQIREVVLDTLQRRERRRAVGGYPKDRDEAEERLQETEALAAAD